MAGPLMRPTRKLEVDMTRTAYWILLASSVGCSAGQKLGDDFRQALPAQSALEVATPVGSGAGPSARSETDTSGGAPGELAQFYILTRQTSERLNGAVGSVMGTVWGIAHHPPSQVSSDFALWGPFTPTLSPATYRLIVARAEPGRLAYHLDGRPKTAMAEAAFQPIVVGHGVPVEGGLTGNFSVNLELAHRLDPLAMGEGGALSAEFALAPDRAALRVHLEEPASGAADYRYDGRADGSGDFRFIAHGRFLGDSAPPDRAAIRSRWNPTGAGRADAHIEVSDPPGAADVVECWNPVFQRVFFARPGMIEGSPEACVFTDALPADL